MLTLQVKQNGVWSTMSFERVDMICKGPDPRLWLAKWQVIGYLPSGNIVVLEDNCLKGEAKKYISRFTNPFRIRNASPHVR